MKKLVLTIVCALAMTSAVFAQGFVNWGAISAAGLTAQTNEVTFSPLFGGGASGLVGATIGNTATAVDSFYYELLYLGGAQVSAPTTLAGLEAWSDAGLSALNSASAGRLGVVNGTVSVSVPWAAGTTDNIILVGWSANLGTSWLTVSNELATGSYISILQGLGQQGFFGISAAGYEAANGANPGSTIIGGGASVTGFPIQSLLTPLYLLPVPEPATLALAGLGGLAMLAFRRQRK